MAQFTWLPFFEEMLSVICSRYDKNSLCNLCHEILGEAGGLTDEFPDGSRGPLREIDPLTFIGYFNRQTSIQTRIRLCEKAKQKLGLRTAVPADFAAIPRLNNQNLWFFGYAKTREDDDMNNLWDFARALDSMQLSDELFRKVLGMLGVGVPKTTVVMFICKPSHHISLDKTNMDYFQSAGFRTTLNLRTDIRKSDRPYTAYKGILRDLKKHFGNKQFYEISHEAYVYRSGKPKPPDSKKSESSYWVIAPGQNARLWDDFKDNGLIAIGGDKLGDLSCYPDKKSIREKLVEIYGSETSRSNDALACYEFASIIKPGDYVFARKGSSEVIGYGRIMSPYIYDSTRDEYHHVRKVDWLRTGNWEMLFSEIDIKHFAVKTLTDLTKHPDFVKWILKQLEAELPPPEPPTTGVLDYTKTDAMRDLFMSEEAFDGILDALRYKKNIVLQGPPGVGKTFIAKRLAYMLMGQQDDSRVEMIQFHQSYSYEDFIQGYRPDADGKFDLKNGVFYNFCRRAQNIGDRPCIFIIDEINRGNLSKIFGELMLLIEADKRGRHFAVPLTYANAADEKFYIPENVYLIGTMNTADRSLAMVDYALRRRFSFITLEPQFNSTSFKDYLVNSGVEAYLCDKIISRIGNLNKQIADDTKNLGPGYRIGHSFFCPDRQRDRFDEEWYRLIVRHEVEPLLREYWFDNSDKTETAVASLLE